MANVIVNKETLEGRLTSIGNSIRTKGETSEKLDFYNGDYERAIEAMQTGGAVESVNGFTGAVVLYSTGTEDIGVGAPLGTGKLYFVYKP